MPIPQIRVRKFTDGREVARFRDNQGLVRTSLGMTSNVISSHGYSVWRGRWTRAEQVKKLADYGIALQIDQARSGIGSDGQRMPPLSAGGGRAVFTGSVNSRARFVRKTYMDWKQAHGLQPIRDLYGAGVGGHMLDSIRINYLDDQKATLAITTEPSKTKARMNEKRAPWWGWTPDSVKKLREYAAELFGTGLVEQLFTLGLIGASATAFATSKLKSASRSILRKAA